jgi:hypothetical protein
MSRYDDVWARDQDICAYCAALLPEDAQRCPGCGRRLLLSHYLYAEESTNQVTLWVLVAATGFLYLTLLLADLLQRNSLPIMALHAFLGLLFLGLSAGLYLRYFWAWAASIPLLMVTLFLGLLRLLGIDTTVLLPAQLEQLAPPVVSSAVLQTVISAAYTLLLVAQAGALLSAIIFAGPDFSRTQQRLVARLERRLANAMDYYVAGRRYARQGMWATAVLHWQRAAAQAPTNWRFLLALAEGYAELGFFERSLDVLQSASAVATGSAVEDVKELRRLIEQRQLEGNSKQGRNRGQHG